MNNIIEEKDITAVILSLELEVAVIQHVLQDDEAIYVTEDGYFNFWIRILNKRGLIGFSTHTYFRKSITHSQRLEFCNTINSQYFMITAYTTDDEKLKIDHVINYRDGILQATFIRSCRQFSRTIETAMQELDPEHLIVLLPGQTESEDAESE